MHALMTHKSHAHVPHNNTELYGFHAIATSLVAIAISSFSEVT